MVFEVLSLWMTLHPSEYILVLQRFLEPAQAYPFGLYFYTPQSHLRRAAIEHRHMIPANNSPLQKILSPHPSAIFPCALA